MGKLIAMLCCYAMDNHSLGRNRTPLETLKSKITLRGNLPHISIQQQLEYVDELSQFPLGRELLEKRSLDTLWTDVITTHPRENVPISPLENFILNRSPFTLAWRELLALFQHITQQHLKNQITLASIPCGAMRELLDLNYSKIPSFTIIGMDIDTESLELAQKLAKKKALSEHVQLYQQDAWKLPYNAELDLITSCGLNIYVSDKQKVLELYREFCKALKPGGKLIIGFLTYPPNDAMPSEWRIEQIAAEDLFLESVLYKDILDVQWRNFRTSYEFESELRLAGFSNVSFYYDTLHVYPTVVAEK